jgi:hypothetical protein
MYKGQGILPYYNIISPSLILPYENVYSPVTKMSNEEFSFYNTPASWGSSSNSFAESGNPGHTRITLIPVLTCCPFNGCPILLFIPRICRFMQY